MKPGDDDDVVYWYSFSNHYTRECIHTCERERTCGSSQSSPGFVLAPSSWCRHASHAHHPPSPPCLVSSQAGFGMQCYSPPHARWPQCVYRGRVQADPVYLWSSLHAPLDYIDNLYIHMAPHLTT